MVWIRAALIGTALLAASAQQLPPPMPPGQIPPGFEGPGAGQNRGSVPPKPVAQEQGQAAADKAAGAKPVPEAKPASETKPASEEKTDTAAGSPSINVQNASLTDMIAILARDLKINYILDPKVRGSVTLNTYGETRPVNARALLETILHINGQAMVQVGDVYRIVPMASIARLPMEPQVDPKTFPEDERMMLNLVFLKYSTVEDLSKLLEPFLGEGARMFAYTPANLLLILDNSRNMKRTMDMIGLFDSDTLAGQRVRLFEVKNSRPSDIAKELDAVLKSISLGDKGGAVRFLAVDRINTVVAIAPNPGAFTRVEEWLKKLDIPQKATAGTMDNYVYRVKYGMAQMLAGAIMQLYIGYAYPWMGGYGMGMGGGMYGGGMYGGGYGGNGPGMVGGYGVGGIGAMSQYGGGGMYGGGMYGGGMYGGGYGGGGYGGMGMGMGGYPGMYGGMPMMGYGMGAPVSGTATNSSGSVTTTPGGSGQGQDLTGSYLGSQSAYSDMWSKVPRVIPNPFDNTLLIHANPQDYDQIQKLLTELDVPPRQVLVEARIYEVQLTGQFAAGVQAALLQKGDTAPDKFAGRALRVATSSAGAIVTAGSLVGNSKQLLALLTAAEDNRQAKLVSAPSLIATDSIPASMNVGDEVPTLSAQAVSGTITGPGGNPLFAQSVQNKSTGVTLNVLARINPSGIITMVINQDVSAPVAPSANAAIQSPSFSHRTVQTQITLQDGDTIAIGGIIQETSTSSSAGVPGLHRIPVLGAAFGAKSINKTRTEMVIFMTPHVIYDTNQLVEASDQLKSAFKRLDKSAR